MKRFATVLACLLVLSMVGSTMPLIMGSEGGVASVEASASELTSLSYDGADYTMVADGVSMTYHAMTDADVASFQDVLGTAVPGTDYNVFVDDRGTGLAPPTDEQWASLRSTGVVATSVNTLTATYASSLDLSASPYFPKVGDQLSQGSCAAWAMTYYAYGYMEAADNGWSQASAGLASQLLSPAFTYNRISDYDMGSSLAGNGYIIRDWGVATMATMPYNVRDCIGWGSDAALREAAAHRAASVSLLTDRSVDSVKALLTAGKPVTFAIDALQYNAAFKDNTGMKIISASEYNGSASLNHAQCVVGWDDSVTEDGEVGAFKIVNSWGSGFGNGGYYWITYAAFAEMVTNFVPAYINDLVDYIPTAGAVVEFSPAPGRDTTITVLLQSDLTGATVKTKKYYYRTVYYNGAVPKFPSLLYLDITELANYANSTNCRYSLSFSGGVSLGSVSAYRIERYEGGYVPGSATQISPPAANMPKTTSGAVPISFKPYVKMSANDALETSGVTYSGTGVAKWVPVTHRSSSGGDAMQSGMVADGLTSSLLTYVSGPSIVTFKWMVASSSTADVLSVSLDGIAQQSISGTTGWAQVSVSVPSGTHVVNWTYAKSASPHGAEDAGYIDSLTLTAAAVPDTSAPTSSAALAGTKGTDPWYVGTVTATISAADSGSGVSSTKYRLDGGSWTTYSSPVSITADGTHSIEYYSQDVSGNVEAVKSVQFKKDSTAPTVTHSVSGYTVTLSANDAISGVRSVEYRIGTAAWTAYTSPFVATVDGVQVIVEFRATDVAGNSAPSTSISVGTVDSAAPVSSATMSATSGTNGWIIGPATVLITAADEGTGVSETYFSLDGSAWTLYAGPITVSADGAHMISYYSVDRSGNIEAAKSISMKKDAAAPESIITISGSTVTLSSVDVTSGVLTIYYRIDGGSWTIYTGPFNAGVDGVQHLIDYYAKDMAGNTEAVDQATQYVATGVTPVAPSAPTSLRVSTVVGGIKLYWTAPTNIGSAPLLGYKVYRALGTGTPVLLGTTATAEYVDSTMVANTQYRYTVSAYSSAGESSKLGPLIIKLSKIKTAPASAPLSLGGQELSSIDTAGLLMVEDAPDTGSAEGQAMATIAWIMGLPLAGIALMGVWLVSRHGLR